jgi:hypothetical protein
MNIYHYEIMKLEHPAYYKTTMRDSYRVELFLNFIYVAKILIRSHNAPNLRNRSNI